MHRFSDQFSSVQFAKINVLSAKALQDHDTVISVIDAVVAGKEMSSRVAGMRTKMVRRRHWAVARSTLELLRLGMRGRQVAGTTTSVLEAERSRWRE